MKVSVLRTPALALALGAAGCSHSHMFDANPPVSALQPSPLQGRRIYVDLSAIDDAYETGVEGQTFTITGIRDHASALVHHLFAQERFVPDRTASDTTLRGELSLDLGSTFGGTKCNAHARWTIASGDRKAVGEGDGTSSIGVMSNGGNNCEIAALNAHAAALDAAFAKLR